MKNKQTLFLVLLLWCFTLKMYAQEINVPLSFGLGGGVDFISNQDKAASPLDYNGFGLPVGINAFAANQKWIHQFELRLILPLLTNNYPLRSKVNTRLKSWTKFNLNYQVLRATSPESQHYVGGSINSSLFFREYDFFDGQSWEFSGSLQADYAYKINIGEENFVLPQVSLPLTAYINRKPDITFDEAFLDTFYNGRRSELLDYGNWKFIFQDWFAFRFDFLYHLKLSEKLNLQGKAGLNYYQISFPEKVRHLNLPVRCYLNYQF